MPLAVVGISHDTAPVEIREQLAYGPSEASQALLGLREAAGAEEAVLLSTCNRTEVYLYPASRATALDSVRSVLERKGDVMPARLGEYLFEAWGPEAVGHLFRVCAGLDSMVTGEAEIQGQVKEAYERAAELPASPPMAGPVLNRLFQTALSVGGRVRSETPIGRGAASVASVAVELATKIFGSLKGKRVLILGAGMTGELIVEALAREGVEGVVVANRTYDRAIHLARKHRGHAVRFEKIREILGSVDIVLSSTAAPHPVIDRSILRASFTRPRRHPLLIIDVAVPRDVEPAVGDEPEVFLYNVDDLRKIVDEHVGLREEAIPEADRIIREGSDDFAAWYASLEVVPVIRRMRSNAEELREAELERLLSGLGHLSAEDRERIEEFSRRLQNKLLHEPTVRLRKGMSEGAGSTLVDAVRFLYGLDSHAGGGREEDSTQRNRASQEAGESLPRTKADEG